MWERENRHLKLKCQCLSVPFFQSSNYWKRESQGDAISVFLLLLPPTSLLYDFPSSSLCSVHPQQPGALELGDGAHNLESPSADKHRDFSPSLSLSLRLPWHHHGNPLSNLHRNMQKLSVAKCGALTAKSALGY